MENGVGKTTVTCDDNQGNGGIETHGSWPGVETLGSWPGVETHGSWPGVETHGSWPGQQGRWPGIWPGQQGYWPGQYGSNIQPFHNGPESHPHQWEFAGNVFLGTAGFLGALLGFLG